MCVWSFGDPHHLAETECALSSFSFPTSHDSPNAPVLRFCVVLIQQLGVSCKSEIDKELLDFVKLSCIGFASFLRWDDEEENRSSFGVLDKELLITAELVVSKHLLPEILHCQTHVSGCVTFSRSAAKNVTATPMLVMPVSNPKAVDVFIPDSTPALALVEGHFQRTDNVEGGYHFPDILTQFVSGRERVLRVAGARLLECYLPT